jgi:hypothetical protein
MGRAGDGEIPSWTGGPGPGDAGGAAAGGVFGCSGKPKVVVPGMQDLIDNFKDKEHREAALDKYGAHGAVPKELSACEMSRPVITKSEEKDGVALYTLESRVEKCEHSPTAVGTTRVFTIGWKDGKIVSFEWGGPKSGKVEY